MEEFVLDFSLLEVDEVTDRLVKINENSKNLSTKRSTSKMIDLLNYRKEFLLNLVTELENKDITIEEVKKTASGLSTWREDFYNPEVKLFLDATLVYQAEIVIEKVGLRLEKINKDVKKIEARIEGEPLTPLLQDAVQNFEKAQCYYSQARNQVFDLFEKRITLIDFDKTEEEVEAPVIETEIGVLNNEDGNQEEEVVTEPAQQDINSDLVNIEDEVTEEVSEEVIIGLAENNTEIEKMHQAVQLYAEQVSNFIRQTYKAFLKMSTKAKLALSS